MKLTAQEYKLLSYLMHHKGKVVSRTELIEHIYDQDFDRDSNTIEVFVTRIRKKLGPDVITTIRGLGYSLEDAGLERRRPRGSAAAADERVARRTLSERRRTGSLSRRMIVVAAAWIAALLLIGGFALDRVLTRSIVDNFDNQLVMQLNKSLVAASEIGPDGEVRFNRPPADQRFIEPYSGLYFQISGTGSEPSSRSLWDRRLRVMEGHGDVHPHLYDSNEFSTPTSAEPLRIADVILPGSKVRWRFQVAQSRETIDEQIRRLRSTLTWSFTALGIGLLVLAALQTFYGLWPLRHACSMSAADQVGRKDAIGHDFPTEIRPLTEEINQLLAHSEAQAEEARRHAGNLAHALKTPLTVITNAATAKAPDLRTPSAERRP